MTYSDNEKRPICKERFKEVMSLRGKNLFDISYNVNKGQRTIRRWISKQTMPIDLLNEIAGYLDVDPEYLCGTYDHKIEQQYTNPDKIAQKKKQLNPNDHPYVHYLKRQQQWYSYIYALLIDNNINPNQYEQLPSEQHSQLKQELDEAVSPVLDKYFRHLHDRV